MVRPIKIEKDDVAPMTVGKRCGYALSTTQSCNAFVRALIHPTSRGSPATLEGGHNLGNLWRRLGLPTRIDTWSLTSLQQRLMKTGGRLVKHARYYWLLLAEGHLTRRLFGAILRRLTALSVPAG
jgi:hypothetical protein